MNLDVKNYSIEELLSRKKKSLLGSTNIFVIPRYQRSYTWGEKQWEELLIDVLRGIRNTTVETDYWGSILIHKDGNTLNIVDGQQRLITVFLFMLALEYDICTNTEMHENVMPLKFLDKQNDVFVKLVKKESLDSDSKRSQIARAKEWFANQTYTDKTLIVSFLKKTQVSVVIIDNEIESNLLFGRLNTRGLPLQQVDLIKYWIFAHIDKNTGSQLNDEVLEKWHKLQEVLCQINVTVERFIPLWWKSRYHFENITLFESFNINIDSSNYLKFLDDLFITAQTIKVWRDNKNGNDNKIGRNLWWFLKFASDDSFTALIAMADTSFDNKPLLMEIFTVFEFVREVGNLKSGYFIEQAKITDIYLNFARNKFKNFFDLKKAMLEILPSLDDFQRGFGNLRFTTRAFSFLNESKERLLSRYAIYTLNNWQDITNHGDGEKTRTVDDDDYSIEHILPQYEADNEDSHQIKIGNLMVLEKAINKDLSNKSISEKVKFYRKSSYPQVRQFLNKTERQASIWRGKDTWDASQFSINDIELRGDALATLFLSKVKELLSN